MVTFAIDNMPSLTDDRPYASYEVELQLPVMLAGFGPLSDGVPLPRGAGGDSELEMPAPPKRSYAIAEADTTKRMRKV